MALKLGFSCPDIYLFVKMSSEQLSREEIKDFCRKRSSSLPEEIHPRIVLRKQSLRNHVSAQLNIVRVDRDHNRDGAPLSPSPRDDEDED